MINKLKEIKVAIYNFYSYKGIDEDNTRIWINESSVIILCDKKKAGLLIGRKGHLVKELEAIISEIMNTAMGVHIVKNRTKAI